MGQAFPAGRARSVVGRGRCGVRVVAVGTRQGLSPFERHSRRLGHRGQRAGDGVRQHGRHLGHRRRVHARSGQGRPRLLRRIPDQRAGRGRRRRHPHAAISHRRSAAGGRCQARLDGRGDARSVWRTRQGVRPAGDALPRHAGHRIHRAAGQIVDAADAVRQAHRQGRAEDRGRHGRGRADLARGSCVARRPAGARSIAPPDAGSQGDPRCADQGAAGLARRRIGHGRIRQRYRGKARCGR